MPVDSNDQDKPFWHCFWPLSPPPPDHLQVKLLAAVRVKSPHGWDWHISLMGRDNIIDVLAVSVPAHFMLTGTPYQDLVGEALSRTFAAVSMIYSADVKLLSLDGEGCVSAGMYSDEELPKLYPLQITLPQPDPPILNIESLFTFAAHEELQADAVCALSEALRSGIPRHYRFLSLCRALELLVPNARRRSEWLERYEGEFRALNIDPKLFRNYIPQLRARCAHGQISQERAIFGIQTGAVPLAVFDLLMKAVIDRLNETPGVHITPPIRPVVGEPLPLN